MDTQRKIGIIIAVIAIVVVLYFYLFLISSVFVQKPFIEKTVLRVEEGEETSSEKISSENINWAVNELGAYKLHTSLSGEKPEIEFVVNEKTFAVDVVDNKPVTKEGNATNPDIRIRTTPEIFAEIYNAENLNEEVVKMHSEGKIRLELLKDKKDLILKGYKGIYDKLK